MSLSCGRVTDEETHPQAAGAEREQEREAEYEELSGEVGRLTMSGEAQFQAVMQAEDLSERPETRVLRDKPMIAPVPRLALSMEEASSAIGVSKAHFKRHVLPRLRVVTSGRRCLIPVIELQRYLGDRAV